MSKKESAAVEAIDLSNDRAVRALSERMSVLPESADLYTVVGEHGSTYTVDLRDGVCECPDSLHRGTECKHQIRTRAATGRLAIPGWVDRSAVDPLLGAHVAETPRLVATDGGAVVGAETDDVDDDRLDDCECSLALASEGLPCWPCFRDGYETPAPEDLEEGEE